MVGTLVDVLQRHNVLMLDPAKQQQTISKAFYFKFATCPTSHNDTLRELNDFLILMIAVGLQKYCFAIKTLPRQQT